MNKKYKIAFFGSSSFSVSILEKLKENNFTPSLIITVPDKPSGRKLKLSPTPVKIWAKNNNIEIKDPEKLNNETIIKKLKNKNWDIFITASYGKIIPKEILEIPKRKTLNIHPSLLPKLRGSSPIQTAILKEKETGVTIMVVDEFLDHGPIVSQKKLKNKNWPIDSKELEKLLITEGGNLLIEILTPWLEGKIEEKPQNENLATFSKKIEKKDYLINLDDNPEKNFKKILAYSSGSKAYFIFKHKDKEIRVKVTEVSFKKNKLIIEKVIPEGKKEMNYQDFLRGYST